MMPQAPTLSADARSAKSMHRKFCVVALKRRNTRAESILVWFGFVLFCFVLFGLLENPSSPHVGSGGVHSTIPSLHGAGGTYVCMLVSYPGCSAWGLGLITYRVERGT